jgi:flagellar basal body rod protein FlgG
MNVGLYQGVAAMVAGERRLDAVAHNLANVSTPAFKRLASATQADYTGRAAKKTLSTSTVQRYDFTQGMLERTESPLDLALYGEGFFAVEGPGGEEYTRDGSFRVDDKGVLQTIDGRMVAWNSARGRIDPVGEPVTVDTAGTVKQGARLVGKLRVVAFDDPSKLSLGRDGAWRAPAKVRSHPAEAEVHQGALERSNVNAVDELVELVAVQRNFESAKSLLDMIDQSYRRLNNLG